MAAKSSVSGFWANHCAISGVCVSRFAPNCSVKISSGVSAASCVVLGAYKVALPCCTVLKILFHTRLFGKSTAIILAFHLANHVSGPASEAAPNSTMLRSDKSNHSGCAIAAFNASAWLGSIMPAASQIAIWSSKAWPCNFCPRYGTYHSGAAWLLPCNLKVCKVSVGKSMTSFSTYFCSWR